METQEGEGVYKLDSHAIALLATTLSFISLGENGQPKLLDEFYTLVHHSKINMDITSTTKKFDTFKTQRENKNHIVEAVFSNVIF